MNTCSLPDTELDMEIKWGSEWRQSMAPQSLHFIVLLKTIYFHLFNFWLCWVFIALQGLSLVVVSGGLLLAVAAPCGGFPCCGAPALGTWASVVAAHGLRCSASCGIFANQGLNPCCLHWQVDAIHCANREVPKTSILIRKMPAENKWALMGQQLRGVVGSGGTSKVLLELGRGSSSLSLHQKLQRVHDLKQRIRTSEQKERESDMHVAGVGHTWRNGGR